MSPEQIRLSPSDASIAVKSKSVTSLIVRRRSEQTNRTKKRNGGENTRSRSLGRPSTASSSSSLCLSPTPKRPSSVGNMRISATAAMSKTRKASSPSTKPLNPPKDSSTKTEPSTPTQSRRLPNRRIAKSSSQQMKRSSQLTLSRKQVTPRSASFSGRASAKTHYKGVSQSLLARKGSEDDPPRAGKPLRRRVSSRKRSSKVSGDKRDGLPIAASLTPAPPTSSATPTPVASKNGEDKATTSQMEQGTVITKGPRTIRFYDKIRFKSITHSRVDPNSIWFSKVEIAAHRKREQEVKNRTRSCRNFTILNVEGLVTEKQRRGMHQRRLECKEAILDIQDANRKQKEHDEPASAGGSQKGGAYAQNLNDDYNQDEAMAEEYERLTVPASQGALERAARLATHVTLLWDPVFEDMSTLTDSEENFGNEPGVDIITTAMIKKFAQRHPMEFLTRSIASSSKPSSKEIHQDPNTNLRQADVKSWLGTGSAPPKLPKRQTSGEQKNTVSIRKYGTNRKVLGQ